MDFLQLVGGVVIALVAILLVVVGAAVVRQIFAISRSSRTARLERSIRRDLTAQGFTEAEIDLALRDSK